MLDLGGKKGRSAGCVGTDPLRLTVSFEGDIGGYEADEILIEGVLSKLSFVATRDTGGGVTSYNEYRGLLQPNVYETVLQTPPPPRHWCQDPTYAEKTERVRRPRAHTHTTSPSLSLPSAPVAPPRARADFGVYAELPAPGYITFVFGPGSTAEHGQKLAEALRHIAL